MNLHTFKDVVNDKKSSLVNELDEGDEEKDVGVLRKPVEGEEEEGDDKVSSWWIAQLELFIAVICFVTHSMNILMNILLS